MKNQNKLQLLNDLGRFFEISQNIVNNETCYIQTLIFKRQSKLETKKNLNSDTYKSSVENITYYDADQETLDSDQTVEYHNSEFKSDLPTFD